MRVSSVPGSSRDSALAQSPFADQLVGRLLWDPYRTRTCGLSGSTCDAGGAVFRNSTESRKFNNTIGVEHRVPCHDVSEAFVFGMTGIPRAQLQLPVRVVNALEDHDVIFVEDLMALDYKTLLTMKNFGEATFREAQSAIRKVGLKASNYRNPPKPKRGRKTSVPSSQELSVGSMLELW